MKTRRIITGFLLVFSLLAVGSLFADAGKISFPKDSLVIQTPTAKQRFIIEVATTPNQQEQGLMFRKAINDDHGMLFLQPRDIPMTMWMKNTLIPLDMVFIDKHGEIVQIAADAKPESLDIIQATQPVRAVLELGGGVAAKDGIHVGDKVIYSAFKP